ncbi:hypothetical protein AB7783_24125 [Tardiphaga sp. 172_B4_N1_3]|uniref:hypothetical protein n=1 Tax=Tardiphaga sp. 172_B4_N1_3 TaxID=3240787 RepID=UPI003F88D355
MHRARLRPDHQEDHGGHPNLVRQDHGHQGHRGDQTEAHPQQAVCPAQPELPTALVLLQEALTQGESQPLAALPVLEPVSAQQQVPAARQAVLLQAVSPALRLVALQARGVRRPAALHRVHGAQDALRRARDVRDAQRAALALPELQAQRWALEVRRAGPEARREPAAELGAAAERRPEEEAWGEAVQPQVVGVAAVPGVEEQLQAAVQQEAPEARDAQQEGEPVVAAVAPQGARQAAQLLAEPWVVPSGEPWARLQAQQVRPARARSAHRHSTHKQRSLRYAQRRASSWPAIRDEVLS